jgi:hypothetical protein
VRDSKEILVRAEENFDGADFDPWDRNTRLNGDKGAPNVEALEGGERKDGETTGADHQ